MDITCRSMRPEDYPAVKEIIAESFAQHVGDNPDVLPLLAQEPWYDPDHLFVAEVDGRPVSQLGVRDGVLWVAGAAVPAGLVGTVCTRERYRGRKIGSQLLRYAFAWMERRDLAISYLHTGPDRHGFYGRLGYKKSVIEYPRLVLDLPSLSLSPTEAHVRPATLADARFLDHLYTSCYGRSTSAWSRSTPFWERRIQRIPKLWSKPLTFRVAGDAQPLAYLATDEAEGAGTVQEFACLPEAEDLAASLLQQTLGEWQNRRFQIADLAISSTHPLRPLADALYPEDKTSYDVIFIRVQAGEIFLQAVLPLLKERTRSVDIELTVSLSDTDYSFTIGSGRPFHLELQTSDLASLIYNGRRLPGLRLENGIVATPDDPDALHHLFPDTGAFRCSLDGY